MFISDNNNFSNLRKFKVPPLYILLAFVIIAIGLAIFFYSNRTNSQSVAPSTKSQSGSQSNKSKASLSVVTTTAQKISDQQMIHASGNIVPWQEAIIGADSSGLRIAEVLVNVGDQVRKGQVLVRLANTTTIADKLLAEANLLQAQANYENAQKDAERARSIANSGSISASQVEQYLTQEKVSKAQLAAAQASFKAQKFRLENTTIIASDNGVISSRTASVGMVVAAGQELFRLIRQNKLEWLAEVIASDLEHIEIGQTVQIYSSKENFAAGKVRAIAPSADAKTRFVTVYVSLPVNANLRANTFVQGDFIVGKREINSISNQAIIERDGFSYVFVLGKDSKVEQRKVVVGIRNKDFAEIKSGLAINEKVVFDGAGFLNDGDLVHEVQR